MVRFITVQKNTILRQQFFQIYTVLFTAAGLSDQLEDKLKVAQADKQHAERQEAAGQRILTRTRDEKNKLQDANIKQAEELKDIRAQLSDALKENRKLKGGIFSMSLNLTFIRSPDGKNLRDLFL